MPLYEYECEVCEARFELIQRFADPPAEACRKCGGPVHRLPSAPAIQFKGSGWYITDYARKGKSDPAEGSTPAAESKSASSSSNGSSGDGKPAPGSPSPDAAKTAPATTTTTSESKSTTVESK